MTSPADTVGRPTLVANHPRGREIAIPSLVRVPLLPAQ